MERLHLVGPGRIGLAIADALVQAEAVDSVRVFGRRPEPPSHPLFTQGVAEYIFGLEAPEPRATVVLLTVPDAILPELAHAMAAHPASRDGIPVLHTSGSLSGEVLAPLHARGYSVGSFFPLQTVPHSVMGAEMLRGSGVVVSGERGAIAAAHRLAAAIEATAIEVPVSQRPAVHAASLLVSNGIAGLMSAAEDLFATAGVSEEEARSALLRMAEGAVEGIRRFGPAKGTTGPVADGDVEAVALHIRALPPEIQTLYREIGRAALARSLAEAGIDPGTHDRFLELFG